MQKRHPTRLRSLDGGDSDCAACPAARRCWGDTPLPGEGVRARREPRLERGSELFHQGERPRAVYVVVSGCLILRETLADGVERIVGFRLPGEIVGIEGWGRGTHTYTAEATAATTVCQLVLPPAGTGLASGPLLERLLIKCAAQLDRSVKPWPGLPAIERVAAFVEDFAQRTQVKGSSSSLFRLPMTRADIGSYLGLAEETVVRALGQLSSVQRLNVQGRTVRLGDTRALVLSAGSSAGPVSRGTPVGPAAASAK